VCAELVEEAGDVDILANNAGFSWFGPTVDLDAGKLDALFDSNVRAPHLLVAAFAPAMAAKGSGSIISRYSPVRSRRLDSRRHRRDSDDNSCVAGMGAGPPRRKQVADTQSSDWLAAYSFCEGSFL
jgi:NAD(P)-dependent dehydrogenase (short-subunit alcohol dehydrogenase family)